MHIEVVVGDAAQPLHTTRHHHGWVGDNPFIFLDTAKIRATGWKPAWPAPMMTTGPAVMGTSYVRAHGNDPCRFLFTDFGLPVSSPGSGARVRSER